MNEYENDTELEAYKRLVMKAFNVPDKDDGDDGDGGEEIEENGDGDVEEDRNTAVLILAWSETRK